MPDLSSLAAWSTVATAVLALVLLLVVLGGGGALLRAHRRQADELARLRREVAGLRKQQAQPADGEMPRIGAAERVFQVGDNVTVIEGLHRGDMGTVAERPDWLKPGYVCVDLSRAQLQAYIATSKLEPLRP